MKFKVGERVAVYDGFGRDIGIVEEIRDGILSIGSEDSDRFVAHPKQCRRLVKKPKRRVFLRESAGGNLTSGWTIDIDTASDFGHPNGKWIEFIEVRRKK